MSMNGIDYTKQLAREREYYQDSNRKMKEAAQAQVDNANNRAEQVITNNRDNFIKERADLEQHYQTTLNSVKEKTAATIDNKNFEHQKNLDKEKEKFYHESQAQSSEFNQRLKNLRSDYTKSLAAETDRNKTHNEFLDNKYNSSVKELQADKDSTLKSFQDKMADAGAGLRNQYAEERGQLTRTHEDKMSALHKDSTEKMAELRTKVKSELTETNKVHKAEMANQKKYADDTVDSLQKNFQERSETMNTDYAQRTQNLVNKQHEAAKATTRKHQEEVSDIRRGFNDRIRQAELDKRRLNNGDDEFAEFSTRQQGLKDQVVYENKIKNLKDDLASAQKLYEERAISDARGYKNTLKEEAAEAIASRDQKLNIANADKLLTVAKEREKAQEKVANREHQNRLDKAVYEAQIMNERAAADGRLKKLKENYHTSMTSLEQKHQERIENVTRSANEDKKLFAQEMQESRAKEISEMKYEFNKLMDNTVQDYESRLENYQRETAYLKQSLENKVQNIVDETEKQLVSQRNLFEDRKNADQQLQKVITDKRENELRNKFTNINNTYQKKLDKIQLESAAKLKLITNEYESKLKELQAKTNSQVAMKDTSHKVELERVKQSFEQEKIRLVSTYEAQIDSIKNGHKDQMDQMKQYNRLS